MFLHVWVASHSPEVYWASLLLGKLPSDCAVSVCGQDTEVQRQRWAKMVPFGTFGLLLIFRGFVPVPLLLTQILRLVWIKVQIISCCLWLFLLGLFCQGVVSPGGHLRPFLVNHQEFLECFISFQLLKNKASRQTVKTGRGEVVASLNSKTAHFQPQKENLQTEVHFTLTRWVTNSSQPYTFLLYLLFRKHFKEKNKTIKEGKSAQVKHNKTCTWFENTVVETGLSRMQCLFTKEYLTIKKKTTKKRFLMLGSLESCFVTAELIVGEFFTSYILPELTAMKTIQKKSSIIPVFNVSNNVGTGTETYLL